MADEQFEFSEQLIAGPESGQIPAHPGQFRDESGVAGVGFGFTTVGVAGPVHRDAGRVEHPLAPLPKERQQQRGAPTGLVNGPGGLCSQSEDLLEKDTEVGLIVLDPTREQDTALGVEHHRPVELLSDIDADPHSAHSCLPCVYGSEVPWELPAVGSLRSDRSSPISSLAVGASQGAGGQILRSHRAAEYRKPSPAPLGGPQTTWTADTNKVGKY